MTETQWASPLPRRLLAELLGSLLLAATVVGSGIMAERLANGNAALALLANTLATGAVLVALILALGSVSGAHMNPAVSLSAAIQNVLPWSELLQYVAAQLVGGLAGTLLAHAMFSVPLVTLSMHARSGPAQVLSEFVATFGLLAVIRGCSSSRAEAVSFAVGSYITAAYWFTASTSFANPAVTIARALSNTFAGIRPVDVAPFILAQIAGALAATFVFRWIIPRRVN